MNNYASWEINLTKNTLESVVGERVREALRFGVLAPSTHNSQPWKIRMFNENEIYISIRSDSILPAADPSTKDIYISLGCFVENVCLAAKRLGLNTKLETNFSDDISQSQIKMIFSNSGQLIEPFESSLFEAITKRVNARVFFDRTKVIQQDVISKLQELSSKEVTTHAFTAAQEIDYFAKKTGEAVKVAQSKKMFRDEFSKIVKNNYTSSYTGMPAFSFGMPDFVSLFIPFVFKHFDISSLMERVNRAAMMASSAIVVITTSNPIKENWFESGRQLERQLLYLTSKGIGSSIHVAMAEVSSYVDELKRHLSTQDMPLMIYRIGYTSRKARHTPRRTLEQCLEA